MEWFWKLVDHLQKFVASSALKNFSLVDWLVLVAIFWGLAQGSRKGFSDRFGKLLGIFFVSMVTLSFYQGGAAFLHANLSAFSVKMAEPFIFVLIAVPLWILVTWGINVFGKFLKVEAQGLLKTLGGMVFGVLGMILLLGFLAQFLLLLPIESVQETFKPGRTCTGYTLSRVTPDLRKFVMSPFRKPILKKPVELYKVGG